MIVPSIEIKLPKHIPTKLKNLDKKHRGAATLGACYEPGDFDICSGRGKSHNKHQGNIWFRSIITKSSQKYLVGETKTDKTKVVESVVEYIRSKGGKFLKRDSKNQWYDVSDREAREKVGHALRDYISKSPRASQTYKESRKRAVSPVCSRQPCTSTWTSTKCGSEAVGLTTPESCQSTVVQVRDDTLDANILIQTEESQSQARLTLDLPEEIYSQGLSFFVSEDETSSQSSRSDATDDDELLIGAQEFV